MGDHSRSRSPARSERPVAAGRGSPVLDHDRTAEVEEYRQERLAADLIREDVEAARRFANRFPDYDVARPTPQEVLAPRVEASHEELESREVRYQVLLNRLRHILYLIEGGGGAEWTWRAICSYAEQEQARDRRAFPASGGPRQA